MSRVVMLDERCLVATVAYGGLAEVLLSGHPVDVALPARSRSRWVSPARVAGPIGRSPQVVGNLGYQGMTAPSCPVYPFRVTQNERYGV